MKKTILTLLCAALASVSVSAATILGSDTNDTVRTNFFSQGNNTTKIFDGLKLNVGTNLFPASMISGGVPSAFTNFNANQFGTNPAGQVFFKSSGLLTNPIVTEAIATNNPPTLFDMTNKIAIAKSRATNEAQIYSDAALVVGTNGAVAMATNSSGAYARSLNTVTSNALQTSITGVSNTVNGKQAGSSILTNIANGSAVSLAGNLNVGGVLTATNPIFVGDVLLGPVSATGTTNGLIIAAPIFPDALAVLGDVKFPTGAAVGKVWTASDTNGLGSWQTSSGGGGGGATNALVLGDPSSYGTVITNTGTGFNVIQYDEFGGVATAFGFDVGDNYFAFSGNAIFSGSVSCNGLMSPNLTVPIFNGPVEFLGIAHVLDAVDTNSPATLFQATNSLASLPSYFTNTLSTFTNGGRVSSVEMLIRFTDSVTGTPSATISTGHSSLRVTPVVLGVAGLITNLYTFQVAPNGIVSVTDTSTGTGASIAVLTNVIFSPNFQ